MKLKNQLSIKCEIELLSGDKMDFKNTVMGIELGSTRIKAVLLDAEHKQLAQGSFEWENKFKNGYWTYSYEEVAEGVRACYADLKRDVKAKTGKTLTTCGAIGISAMMHGYLPLDKEGKPLADFRTWRNTTTGDAAEKLTQIFDFNIPQRWSIAHLYQAILNNEAHVENIAYLTTLAGYVHLILSGVKAVGVGEASGIFPIDSDILDYDKEMLDKFDELTEQNAYPWKLADILPKVLPAGANAGILTKEGAKFLDPDGDLEAGILLAPCEGDAGTGMVATDSVQVGTGNVSAGTSDFAMIVTDKKLGVHREIDMVTTPCGKPVAMVHCNNCTSDINAWVNLFEEVLIGCNCSIDRNELFTFLFTRALEGDADCGGLLNYNYISGEGVTDFDEGRPVFARGINSNFNLANFMRTQIMSALATLKIGLDILTREEKIKVEKIYGHGGLFKTPVVGQKLLSAAIGAEVLVMESAGEGGPYGMALLCSYMLQKEEGETLAEFLDNKVFKDAPVKSVTAGEEDIEGFTVFLSHYKEGLKIEQAAIDALKGNE